MSRLMADVRRNPLLWLLFVLSVLAIVPLAALLSHATESVAAKTGDAVGGLLNATLGETASWTMPASAHNPGSRWNRRGLARSLRTGRL